MRDNFVVLKLVYGSLTYDYIEEEVMYTGKDFIGKICNPFDQGRIQGVSDVSMDTVNILGKNRKKINIYYYYPVRKG